MKTTLKGTQTHKYSHTHKSDSLSDWTAGKSAISVGGILKRRRRLWKRENERKRESKRAVDDDECDKQSGANGGKTANSDRENCKAELAELAIAISTSTSTVVSIALTDEHFDTWSVAAATTAAAAYWRPTQWSVCVCVSMCGKGERVKGSKVGCKMWDSSKWKERKAKDSSSEESKVFRLYLFFFHWALDPFKINVFAACKLNSFSSSTVFSGDGGGDQTHFGRAHVFVGECLAKKGEGSRGREEAISIKYFHQNVLFIRYICFVAKFKAN